MPVAPTYTYSVEVFEVSDPDTVPLKWDHILLHGHVVLYQDASDSGNTYLINVVE